MDTETIYKSEDLAGMSHTEPLREGKVFPGKLKTGDPEIDENLRKVRPEPEFYITGMDEVTGVGWLYHINQVFFYRYCPRRTEFDKMYIQNNDLCRSSQIAVIRPIFFEGALIDGKREVYAVLTTLREIITVKLFTAYPLEKTINLLPQLGSSERLIHASSARAISRFPGRFKDEYEQVDYRYACVTNQGSVYIHTISVVPNQGTGKSQVSNHIQYISGNKNSKSGIMSSFFSILKKSEPVPELDLRRVKISLDDNKLTLITDNTVRSDILAFRGNQCSLTNVLSLSASLWEQEYEVIDSTLVSETNGPWIIFTLFRTANEICLVRDTRKQKESLPEYHVLLNYKLTDNSPEVETESQNSFGDSPAPAPLVVTGKITVFNGYTYVVAGWGNKTVAFRTDLSSQKTVHELLPHSLLGLSVFRFDDEETKLCIFTQEGIFESELNLKFQRGEDLKLEKLKIPSYFPVPSSLKAGILPTVQTISTREAEDLLLNTFYSYENERSSGILPKNTCWPDLTDVVKQIIRKYSNSLTSNLAIMQAVGGRRNSNTPGESFLVFDLEQRTKRVNKFYKMLERNNLFEKMSEDSKYNFLEAFESLSAAVALATEHEKNPEFFNAVSSIQDLRVYEAPLKIPEVLLSLIDGFVGLQGIFKTSSELVFSTIASVFSNINKTRMEQTNTLKINPDSPLPAPWWIHHSSLWQSGQQGFRNLHTLYQSAFSYKYIVSKGAQHELAKALIPELEAILKIHPDSVVHSTFLKELYDGLINDGLLEEAYTLARENKNLGVMSRLLVRPVVQKKFSPALAIYSFGERLVQKLVNTAVQVILSEDDTGDQQMGSANILNTKTEGNMVEAYLSVHYPQLYWLNLVEVGKFDEALKIIPDTGLECLAFTSMMTAVTGTGTPEQAEETSNELVSEFVHRRVLPSDVSSQPVDQQVQYLLGSDDVLEIDRARYSLCLLIQSAKIAQSRSENFLQLKPSLRLVYRYLLDRDKLKPTEELLHKRLQNLIHNSLTLFGYSSREYLRGLQALGMNLDEGDKQTLLRLESSAPG